ncbi:zinc finger homeobox protein 4-like isoform X3 [Biomphalaria glabrata]|uniref:Zinc finger homeobox protein 4-like isoform X3 n=1 Tax=Biomphalaria glabrata TaxID=6526 RepID=A0A9W3AZI7_BIOGL|nr:zinc finger homeobox protein 4-like isoform X3 [Biomphalaria glabrata]
MSTAMDFSPLKMETPHSSPHRTPLKASPRCSPKGEEMMESPAYTNVGYGRTNASFCGSGSRSQYSLAKDEYRVSPDTPCFSRTMQSPVVIGSRSRSPSPKVENFLISENSQSNTERSSEKISNQKSGLDSFCPVGYGKRCSDVARGPTDVASSRDVFDKLSALARDQCARRSRQSSVEIVEDMDEADDSVVLTKEDDACSSSDKEEDDDQIECAECNRVFCNLQRYMDHRCCRPQSRLNALCDKMEGKKSSSPSFISCETFPSDAEIFKGRIVYNPNGSAYIIEGIGSDSELDLKFSLPPDSIVVKDGQSVLSVERSIPKIANAVFFSKVDKSVELSKSNESPHPDDAPKASPVINRYNVYELRSSEIDELLELFPPYPASIPASKPILMCFICKLSFGNPNSFLRHATLDHRMELNEGEKTLLCRPSASALIQAFGREKYPTVTVLQHVGEPHSSLRESSSPTRPSSRNNESVLNNNFLRSPAKSSSPDGSSFSQPSFNQDTRVAVSRSPTSEQDEFLANHRSSFSNAFSANLKREGYLHSPQISGADFLSGSHFLYSSQGDRSPKRQRSPSSVLPSPQRASSPLTLTSSDSFYPMTSASGLLLSSSGHQQHLGMPAPSSSSLQSMGLGMTNYMGSCDEHPQGRAQGVECPKCDIVLGSSQSLGGHMTMTHSRNSCKTLKCPKCNWHYKYQETLEIHMKEKHPDSDAQCVYCLTNQSHPRLARGESYSCGYKPYRCDVCNYSTTTKGNLSIHMQSDKHINNMQDLANGGTEMKMQPPQSPASQPVPPSSSTPAPHSVSPFSQDDSQYKKLKQKQSFRCEVCSYETSVARNLRIHMTSEKHTHNMLVMTQSINHLHQDMTLHQINQMNQLFALNHQEQAARFAAISPHLNTGLFSYENMLMSTSAPPPQPSFELPMNLTKENGIEEPSGSSFSKDANKLFQCCICNNYGSDSIENVHNHIQYDRTKSGNSEAHVTFSNGAYHCNLCSYKTHLKANFQLHCKTDKHLQKLQLVNHVLEGGVENEWRLAISGSPMQICCNACSFYANSTHKMQLHMSTIQHESCSQLFRHLQLLDHATAPSAPSRARYYHCTLCLTNVRTKQKLISHSRTPHHMCKEQSLTQGHLSIFDVFLIKEMSDGAPVDFEDEESEIHRAGFVQHMKIDDDVLDTPDLSQGSRDLSKYPKVTSGGGKVTIPPPAHFSTTTAASSSLGTTSATDYSAFRGAGSVSRDKPGGDRTDESKDITQAHSLTNRISSSPDTSGVLHLGRKSEARPCNDHYLQSNHGAAAHQQSSHGSPSSPAGAARSAAEAVKCILCPLCRHECSGAGPLEEHLINKHNVAPEGIQRLMSMVELPLSSGMATADASVAPSSSAETGKNSSPASGEEISAGSRQNDDVKDFGDVSQEIPRDVSDRANPATPLSQRKEETTACTTVQVIPTTTTSWLTPSPQTCISTSSPIAMSATSSVTTAAASSTAMSATSTTCNASRITTIVTQDIPDNRTLSASDECKEIDLDLLDADHKDLLAIEGVDLALQEKLDKEYEDLFRCQTCHKIFINIDQLYCHQNELGHLELKQTPRGPGYLCWKKGCNQYFKTASTLQVHFREIHAKKSLSGCLSTQELEAYKFTCSQCNFSFKSIEAMQRHTLIHLMQSVTQCRICSRRVNSVAKMRRHLEIVHGDLSLSDMTVQMESIEANASLLFSSPAYEQFTAKMLLSSTKAHSRSPNDDDESVMGNLPNGFDKKDNVDRHDDDVDGDGMPEGYRDKQFMEDYVNSQSMAEEHYKDNSRKFKCHRCRVAYTSQKYLFAHNKTSQHRQWEMTDKFEDPTRPYRCDICKESFTQKNILMVHFNSVSHLHRLKQQTHINGDNIFNTSALSYNTTSPTPTTHSTSSPNSTVAHTNGSYDAVSESTTTPTNKPYKCNICKVSYNNQPSIEIHLRSVGHKTKASKLSELIQSGQVDISQALIEHPDPRTAGKQQAQIVADMIHQQATAQAASNAAAASYFNLQGMQGVMAQLSLLQGILPTSSHHLLASSAQNALAATSNAHIEAFYASLNAHNNINARESSRAEIPKTPTPKDKLSRSGDGDKIMNMIIKQDGKIEPVSHDNKTKPGLNDCKLVKDPKNLTKEEELPPNFPHAPIISRPRGFMGRFKPQLHRSLLENFGFECVMHYNEENCIENTKPKDKNQEEIIKQLEDKEDKKENGEEKMEVEDKTSEDKAEEEKSQEADIDDKKNEDKENMDLPELNKCRCLKCNKDFSNVWVLKNHEEEVHNNFVSPAYIEKFGRKFREDWEKNVPKLNENEQTGPIQLPSNPPTPTSNAEKLIPSEMPPPPPPTQSQIPQNFDLSQLSQLLPLMGLNMLPMHLPLNLPMNLSLPGFPSLMIPPLDLTQSYLPQIQSANLVDTTVTSQQQMQAAAAVAAQQAQNQKRVRTRISDDQLKVLRTYFDINNSPSEDQINKMSDQTGLPQKVIKHWFRNTLFKERQRNKDSPYNFNNPPSTSIDLDEYDRTGKLPEIKLEPEEEEESGMSMSHDYKKDNHDMKVENVSEKDDDQEEEIHNNAPLKIDLAPKNEPSDEYRKDQESHSNTSSPSNMSSIPSTPTASAPATPTPMITANALNAANSLTFSLESYAANIARLEAATFQSMGKRANRTRFTDFQIKTLQDYFERNAYPKDDELEHLSKILGLSARVIVVWFQNARQKARKIYENQPSAESAKEIASPFQRTPGLNYQCKKCSSVFQRYYELIKHQKNSCVGESNNNHKNIHSMMEDDSNYSFSNDDNSFHERQSTPSNALRDRDFHGKISEAVSSSSLTSRLTGSLPVTSSSLLSSHANSSTPTFKCDKCSLTFIRYDLWQEHQKTHVAPAMYTPFSSSSAFGMLQNLAQHEDTTKSALSLMTSNSLVPSLVSGPAMMGPQQSASMASTPTSSSTSPSPSSKRKTDSEDESGEQPRDKRLRTTILPEQLDYLYQQYQVNVDCNPSRKQLEHIASTVNLKKRVVQVWFQNTRARERKGHYRAHQQLINKRCPFCRALFRAKSALESHLATKHPEEMAKGDINIDLIPDALIEPPSPHSLSGSSASHSDISKLLPPGAAATMPNYMAFMTSATGLNLPFPPSTPELLGHPSFDDPFFKKYMSELANTLTARQENPTPSTPSHSTPSSSLSSSSTVTAHSTPKPSHQPSAPNFSGTTRPVDAHKPKSAATSSASSDDAPLDLSKPVKAPSFASSSHSDLSPRVSLTGSHEFSDRERAMELEYLRRLNSLDDSFSETQSEMADNEYMNDVGGSPPSPTHGNSGNLNHNAHTPGSSGKRYRTQMSATQVKVMKHLFQDYKTPTMAECELLGQEIGLAKRVVQVWFQNARAKEKKAKLNSGKPYSAELDFPKSPEECKLCNYKYSHKVTVQDHIFTKTHIDRVKAFLHSDDRDLDLSSSSLSNFSRTPGEPERGQNLMEDSLPSGHLAQLQAMGINTNTLGFPLGQGDISIKSAEKTELSRKEKKTDGSMSKEEQQQQVQAAMEMAMNAQMLSALGGYMPGLDPTYLSYMYGLPGYFPGMGLPVVQPGLMPGTEHMMAFDPLAYGTPLALLQIPAAAIKSVGEKLSEAGAVLARYTQDCQALADLHSVVSSADLTVAAEATLDVGYICKKCQMVYPARESCIAHQRSVCLSSASSLPKGFEPIMKLEQVQYECRACSERFSTILEFKTHCLQESHKTMLKKFKAKEAARREAAGSPSSSAPYSSSIGKSVSPSGSFTSKLSLTSPSNNNNINNNNNNMSPAHSTKPLHPSPAHQFNKLVSSPTSPAMFRSKPLAHSPGFTETGEMKRLKAE